MKITRLGERSETECGALADLSIRCGFLGRKPLRKVDEVGYEIPNFYLMLWHQINWLSCGHGKAIC